MLAPDEVAFEAGVFLLRKVTAESLRAGQPATPAPTPQPEPGPTLAPTPEPGPTPSPGATASTRMLRLVGTPARGTRNEMPPKVLERIQDVLESRGVVEGCWRTEPATPSDRFLGASCVPR
jgi:hypothetical protein